MKQQLERLGKSAFIYGVGGLINRFVSFLLLPLFTAYLTPADYGISSILSLVGFFLIPIFSLGLGVAMAPCYFEANNPARKETTIWTAFILLAASASALAIGGIIFAEPISQLAFQTSQYHYLVTLFLGSTCLSILVVPFTLYLQFEERARLFVVLTAVTTLITISLNLLMVVVFRRGVQGLIEGGLIAQVITFMLFLISTISRIKFQFSLLLSKELLGLGIPLMPASILLFVIQASDRYTLQWYKGLEVVGVYTVGYNIGLVMNLFVNAFTNAWIPYFMSFVDRRDEAQILFGRILTYYVFGFGVLNLLFLIAAKPVILLMTQPGFHEAYKVVGLSASAHLLTGVYSILLPSMYFAKEVQYQTLIQLGTALVAVELNLLLIPPLGLYGAAVALTLSFLAMAFLTYLWNLKRKQVYLKVHYEWNRILGFVLVYAIYMIVMLWERNFSVSAEVGFSVIALIFLPLVLYALLKGSERQALWNILKQITLGRSGQASAKA